MKSTVLNRFISNKIELDSVNFAEYVSRSEDSKLLYSDITVQTFQTMHKFIVPSNRYLLESFVYQGNKVDCYVIFHSKAILFVEKIKQKKLYRHTVYSTTKTEGLYLDQATSLVDYYKLPSELKEF